MSNTYYGLCSLRTGVKIVACYELISAIMFFSSIFVYEMYSKIYPLYDDIDIYYFLQSCIIIITLLKLFSSVLLMQATYENAPSKIFLWIVVACIIYLSTFCVSIKMYVHKVYLSNVVAKFTKSDPMERHLLLAFIMMNLVSVVEILVVSSYYKKEKQLEDVERRARAQNMVSSLKSHRVDIYNIDQSLNSSIIISDQKGTSIFTSFKGIPI